MLRRESEYRYEMFKFTWAGWHKSPLAKASATWDCRGESARSPDTKFLISFCAAVSASSRVGHVPNSSSGFRAAHIIRWCRLPWRKTLRLKQQDIRTNGLLTCVGLHRKQQLVTEVSIIPQNSGETMAGRFQNPRVWKPGQSSAVDCRQRSRGNRQRTTDH